MIHLFDSCVSLSLSPFLDKCKMHVCIHPFIRHGGDGNPSLMYINCIMITVQSSKPTQTQSKVTPRQLQYKARQSNKTRRYHPISHTTRDKRQDKPLKTRPVQTYFLYTHPKCQTEKHTQTHRKGCQSELK